MQSVWEEHSHFLFVPCTCGGEFAFESATLRGPAPRQLEELIFRCDACGQQKHGLFDISAVVEAGLDGYSLHRPWPASSSPSYPMAEQGLPALDENDDFKTFSISGRWQIVGTRSGSMGRVFFCLDLRNPPRFALCKYPISPADYAAHIREIGIYERLWWLGGKGSQHVLELHDIQSTGLGPPALILEAVLPGPKDALTIRDWIDASLVTKDLAIAWTAHIATALQHCGLLIPGFAHGDLKPDNILVAQGWLCKLADFGLSGDALEPAIPGAAAYRAPELWREGQDPTVMSDIYALGCIGYALFSGKDPFHMRNAELSDIEYAHKNTEPQPAPDVPDIVLSCLAKSPENRPTLEAILRAFPHPSTRSQLTVRLLPDADLNNLAAAQIARGAPAAALGLLARSSARNPAVSINLATALSQLGLFRTADHVFAKIQEKGAIFGSNLAAHYARSGRNEAALSVLENIIRRDPRAVEARVTASTVLNNMGQHARALEHAEAAIKIDPKHSSALYQLTYTALVLGRCAKAKQSLGRLKEAGGNSVAIEALEMYAIERCPRIFKK